MSLARRPCWKFLRQRQINHPPERLKTYVNEHCHHSARSLAARPRDKFHLGRLHPHFAGSRNRYFPSQIDTGEESLVNRAALYSVTL